MSKKISFSSDILGSKDVNEFLEDAGATYDMDTDMTYDNNLYGGANDKNYSESTYGGANDKDYSESTYDENALNVNNSQILGENITEEESNNDSVKQILEKKTDELDSDDIDRLRVERLKGDNDLNEEITKKLEKPKAQNIAKNMKL